MLRMVRLALLALFIVLPATPSLAQAPGYVRLKLVKAGLISVQQLDELLDLQATSEEAWQRLGDLAVQHGYVNERQLSDVR